MRNWIIILFVLGIFSQVLLADELQKIDSLKKMILSTDNVDQVDNYLSISETYRSIDVDSTIKYGLIAVKIAQNVGNKEKEAITLRSIGVSYFYFDDLEQAKIYFRESLKAYQTINNKLGISNCLNGMGVVFENSLELDSAAFYYNKSLQLRLELNALEPIASSYFNIGNLHYYLDEQIIAVEYYLKALSIYKELDLTVDEGDTYVSLGIAYNELKSYDKALDYFNNAELIFRNEDNMRSLARVLLNKADIFNFQLNDYNESLKLYRESLEMKKKLNDKSGIALINNNIGTVYGNMENYQSALAYFEKSKKLYTDMENKAGLIMVDHNLGSVYLAQLKFDTAIESFSSSLDAARQAGFNEYITLNNKALIECYAAKGDYENFIKYFKLDNHITDSLLSGLNQAQLNEVEARHLAGELSYENSILKNEVDELSRTTKSRLYIIIGLATLFVMFIVFQSIYVFVKRKNKMEKV